MGGGKGEWGDYEPILPPEAIRSLQHEEFPSKKLCPGGVACRALRLSYLPPRPPAPASTATDRKETQASRDPIVPSRESPYTKPAPDLGADDCPEVLSTDWSSVPVALLPAILLRRVGAGEV